MVWISLVFQATVENELPQAAQVNTSIGSLPQKSRVARQHRPLARKHRSQNTKPLTDMLKVVDH